VVEGDFDYASGFEGARRLLALDDRATAVFAASDQMAMGVYEAARQRGLRVPRTSASSASTTCHRPAGPRRR
jgi:LacI family transcriptional regulator